MWSAGRLPLRCQQAPTNFFCYTYAHLFSISIVCLRFFTVYGHASAPDLAIQVYRPN